MRAPDDGRTGRPRSRMRRCYVLDEDPDLARGLRPEARALARRAATAAVYHLDCGTHPLPEWFAHAAGGPGLLILRGVMTREVHFGDRIASELLGTGDLVRPWDVDPDELVPSIVVWRVLCPVSVALLDRDLAERMRAWLSFSEALLRRLAVRAQGLDVQRAIASHPRVDMRVVMLLWHLAGRWGRVNADGSVRIVLPLTHRLIGELVGAERPSVSVAVSRLSRAGLLTRTDREWCLHGAMDEHAAAACAPVSRRVPAVGVRV